MWSAETNGTDAFTPLALAAVWEPTLRLGTAIVPAFTRGPALIAMSASSLAAAAPGRFVLGLGSSSPVIVGNWNGIEFAEPYRRTRDVLRTTRACSRGSGSTASSTPSPCSASSSTAPRPSRRPIVLAALRAGMLRLAGREADGAILNWLAPYDVGQCVAAIDNPAAEVVARIFVCPTEDAEHARTVGRFMISSYLTVPAYAAFHDWVGRGDRLAPMHEAGPPGTGRPRRPRCPRTSSTTSSCTAAPSRAVTRCRPTPTPGSPLPSSHSSRPPTAHRPSTCSADSPRRADMQIQDTVVVVTGGASGIGTAMARRFHADGARQVVVVDRALDGAQAVADEIGGVAEQVDAADPDALADLVARTLERDGRIDLFCSNAGMTTGIGIDDPADLWHDALELNVMSHVYAARAVLPSMLERGSGYLLQTASAAGLLTSPGDAPYAVTKHGAVAFAEWLARHLRLARHRCQRAVPDGRRHAAADGSARRRRPRRAGRGRLGGDRSAPSTWPTSWPRGWPRAGSCSCPIPRSVRSGSRRCPIPTAGWPGCAAWSRSRSSVATRSHPSKGQQHMPGVKDRVALVTGGAQGIGAAVAARLAAGGAKVGVLDLNKDAAQVTVDQITEIGGTAIALGADVSKRDEAEAPPWLALVGEFFGLHILVNNAGVLRDNLLFKMSDDDWTLVMDVHLRGAFLCSQAAQKHMVEAKFGRIISMSSTSARGNRGQANYSTAKAGLQGLTKTLGIELGKFGITANAIAPGFIETAMTKATAERIGTTIEVMRENVAASIPVARGGGAGRHRQRRGVLRRGGVGLRHRPGALRRRRQRPALIAACGPACFDAEDRQAG